MAVKVTLTQDKDKGPGYGRLTVSGLNQVESVTLRFESNQINQEHLQLNGQWGASPAVHDCILLERNEDNIVIGLEPNTIDALLKNTRATYRVIINADGTEKISPLRIPNNFLGSGAIQKSKPVEAEPDPVFTAPPVLNDPPVPPLPEPDDTAETTDIDLSTDNEKPKKSGKSGLTLIIILLLAAIGLGASWYLCLIPGLPPGPSCQTTIEKDEIVEEQVTEESTKKTAEAEEEPEAPKSLFEQAIALQKQGSLVEAKVKFQKAATEEKHIDAMKKLAEMYDPAFWNEEKSPIPAPNWETANWWWEMAAENGDIDAKRQSGYNMAKYSDYNTEKSKGLAILNDLADQDDAKATELLKEINGE